MVYFYFFTVLLHILYTESQGTEGSQYRVTLYDADLFYRALCASDVLCACEDIAIKNGEQQSRSRADRKRRNRLH